MDAGTCCCCACGGVLVYCLVAKKKQTQTKVQAFDPESAKTGKPPKSDAYECLLGCCVVFARVLRTDDILRR